MIIIIIVIYKYAKNKVNHVKIKFRLVLPVIILPLMHILLMTYRLSTRETCSVYYSTTVASTVDDF